MDVESLQNNFFSQISARHTKEETERIKQAYFMAKKFHEGQFRKTGEPYIIHPIAVAQIVNNDMQLGAAPIIAALLHDVVEDTAASIDDVREQFGEEVAYLVNTVTKHQPTQVEASKQVENFKQMLAAFNFDIRALLIKLADRLHNMRTLKSMKVEKQLKIAAETDFFYAPLANRLGLYLIKSELENLGLQYRSPYEYSAIQEQLNNYVIQHTDAAERWMEPIRKRLKEVGINATVSCDPRTVYSLWYKMHQTRASFKELEHIRVVHINYEPMEKWDNPERTLAQKEKDTALYIYSLITEIYTEKPYSMLNYIDTPKANGYCSLHVKLMGNEGRWMEVHIQSNEMRRVSQYGCLAEQGNVDQWIERFKHVLQDFSASATTTGQTFDDMVSSFYHDDIIVFASDGSKITLPDESSAVDFAYEIHSDIGDHAKYAIINDKLCAVTTILNRGDRIKIGTDPDYHPQESWLKVAQTYRARSFIRRYLKQAAENEKNPDYILCEQCHPLPGDEVVGFRLPDGNTLIHKCNCDKALSLSSQAGDVITKVDLQVDDDTYPVGLIIKAVNRDRYLLDLAKLISDEMKLSIGEITSATTDEIIETKIKVFVHSISELKSLVVGIQALPNVYEVKRESGRIL